VQRQRKADIWQTLLQDEYYKQLEAFQRLLKCDPLFLKYPNPDIEAQFNREDRERRACFRALAQLDIDKVVLSTCVKIKSLDFA
jgi:hypothetical protein